MAQSLCWVDVHPRKPTINVYCAQGHVEDPAKHDRGRWFESIIAYQNYPEQAKQVKRQPEMLESLDDTRVRGQTIGRHNGRSICALSY